MLGKIKQNLHHPSSQGSKGPPRTRQSLSWCPLCGKEGRPNCLACQGELSSETRRSKIETFKRRRSLADQEITALNEHLMFASPAVRKQFAEALSELLVDEFRTANSGKWKGELALGLTAGQILGDIAGG